MKSNDLSEGEELSREACYKHLYITFKYYLTDDPEKIQKFRLLTEYIVNEGIIRAVRYSKSKVVFFYDKNQMTKSESYDLMSNIYFRFFAGNMPMYNFVTLGCKLFDCSAKKKMDTIYTALKRHRNHKTPTPYTIFFEITKFICTKLWYTCTKVWYIFICLPPFFLLPLCLKKGQITPFFTSAYETKNPGE